MYLSASVLFIQLLLSKYFVCFRLETPESGDTSADRFSFSAAESHRSASRTKSFMDFFKRKITKDNHHNILSRVHSTPVSIWSCILYTHHLPIYQIPISISSPNLFTSFVLFLLIISWKIRRWTRTGNSKYWQISRNIPMWDTFFLMLPSNTILNASLNLFKPLYSSSRQTKFASTLSYSVTFHG